MSDNAMKKAVLYARYSSDNQRSESIDAQVRAIMEYATRNGYEITEQYIDEAQTATNDDRENFQRMLADAKGAGWKYVIVHKLDRFARNKYDSAINKRELKQYGIRVISVTENLDDSPESIILESVLEGMAEYYSRNLSREVIKGLRENAHQGKLTGGFPPLGYDLDDDKHYVINEKEADTIRLIFQCARNGMGYKMISDRLNALGFTTKAGKPFGIGSIHDILRNEKYKGMLVSGKWSHSFGSKRSRLGNEKTLRIPDMIPAIIDEPTWRWVNDAISRRAYSGHTGARHVYLLSGLIECGNCGSSMHGDSIRNGYFYRCNAKITKRAHCLSSAIKCENVEQSVIAMLRDYLLNEETIDKLIPSILATAERKATIAATDAIALQERMTELNGQIDKVVDSIVALGGSPALQNRLRSLEDEKSKIAHALIDIELEARIYTTDEEELRGILLADMDDLNSDDPERVAHAIKRHVKRVILTFDPNDRPRPKHQRKCEITIYADVKEKVEETQSLNCNSLSTPLEVLNPDMHQPPREQKYCGSLCTPMEVPTRPLKRLFQGTRFFAADDRDLARSLTTAGASDMMDGQRTVTAELHKRAFA